MIEEISAGGIVFFGNTILMLRKFNGDWVLPKGSVENRDSLKEAAIREVYEESKAKVNVIKYLCKINYEFDRTGLQNSQHIKKIVHWYLMTARDMSCKAQKNEGFKDSRFIPFDRAVKVARYDDERRVIIEAIDDIKYYEYG